MLQNHPDLFDVSEDELTSILEDGEYSEIIYQICIIDWRKLKQVCRYVRKTVIYWQDEKWDKFFNVIISAKDYVPDYLVEYVITRYQLTNVIILLILSLSPNCYVEQLITAFKELVSEPAHLQLVYSLVIEKDVSILESNAGNW